MKDFNEFEEFEPIAGLDEEFDDHYFDGEDLDEDALLELELLDLEAENYEEF